MKLLLLGLLSLPASAQPGAPKQSLFEQVRSFRTAKESPIGAGDADLLAMAVDEALRQALETAPPPAEAPAPVVEEDGGDEPPVDVEAEARRTFGRLVSAYANRRRSAFMRWVGEDYRVDASLLDEALSGDFRTYRIIRVLAEIDQVDVAGKDANLQFHFNMALTTNAGIETKFQGRSRLRMRLEGRKVLLVGQDAPVLFGTSLPATENPQAVSQGSTADAPATGPICPDPRRGSAAMTENATAWRFRTSSAVTPLDQGDFFKVVGVSTMRSFFGRLKNLGAGDLNAVKYVQAGGFSTVVPYTVGDRIAVRTTDNKVAVFKVTKDDSALGGQFYFDWKYQPTAGVRCFP